MSSPDDRAKKQKRLKNKRNRDKVRSPIAKELLVSGKYKSKVVQDKRGNHYDLDKLDHRALIEALQELDE